MKPINSIIFYLIATLLWSIVTAGEPSKGIQNTILYVKSGAGGDCSSWTLACDLQTALSGAVSGDQIWAAAGTYIPTQLPKIPLLHFSYRMALPYMGAFRWMGETGNYEIGR